MLCIVFSVSTCATTNTLAALVIFSRSWNEDGNPKTDWAAAATRAGNRVLAENQARQWDEVKGAVAATGG